MMQVFFLLLFSQYMLRNIEEKEKRVGKSLEQIWQKTGTNVLTRLIGTRLSQNGIAPQSRTLRNAQRFISFPASGI